MRWGNTAHLPADELPVLKTRLGELCRIGAQTHLTPMETRLLIAFARLRPPHTEDRLLGCLYHCPDCESSDAKNVLTVAICRLRAKIRPFCLKINSDWNGHYQLAGDLHVDWRGYYNLQNRHLPRAGGADERYHWSARSLGTLARSIAGNDALR